MHSPNTYNAVRYIATFSNIWKDEKVRVFSLWLLFGTRWVLEPGLPTRLAEHSFLLPVLLNIIHIIHLKLWFLLSVHLGLLGPFQEYVSEWMSHPVFYGNLVFLPSLLRLSSLHTKEGQLRSEIRLIGFENTCCWKHSTSIEWPRGHREDYRSYVWPFHSLVRLQIFPKALHFD